MRVRLHFVFRIAWFAFCGCSAAARRVTGHAQARYSSVRAGLVLGLVSERLLIGDTGGKRTTTRH